MEAKKEFFNPITGKYIILEDVKMFSDFTNMYMELSKSILKDKSIDFSKAKLNKLILYLTTKDPNSLIPVGDMLTLLTLICKDKEE